MSNTVYDDLYQMRLPRRRRRVFYVCLVCCMVGLVTAGTHINRRMHLMSDKIRAQAIELLDIRSEDQEVGYGY